VDVEGVRRAAQTVSLALTGFREQSQEVSALVFKRPALSRACLRGSFYPRGGVAPG